MLAIAIEEDDIDWLISISISFSDILEVDF